MNAARAEVFQDGWLGGENLHIPSYPERHHTTAVVFEELRERVIMAGKQVREHKLPVAAAVFTAAGVVIGATTAFHNRHK